MKSDDAMLFLQTVQTVIILLSFPAIAWQLIQLVQGLRADAYSRAIEDYSQMCHYLLDKPHLNTFLYASNTSFNSLTDPEKDAYNYMGLSLALFERIHHQWRRGWLEQEIWDSWDRWLTDSWLGSELFLVFWKNERRYFTLTFSNYVDGSLKRFNNDHKSQA